MAKNSSKLQTPIRTLAVAAPGNGLLAQEPAAGIAGGSASRMAGPREARSEAAGLTMATSRSGTAGGARPPAQEWSSRPAARALV